MSCEGYTQLLCSAGHLFENDVYLFSTEKCPICQEPAVWSNEVDTTNGSLYGYVELEVNTPDEVCACDHCDNVHIKTHATYHLPPEGVGVRIKR
jgi:hypothetical protein